MNRWGCRSCAKTLSSIPGRFTSPALPGADACLLIAAMLEPQQIVDLAGLARELHLDVLLEVHDEKEMIACATDIGLIGVNNRNLAPLSPTCQPPAGWPGCCRRIACWWRKAASTTGLILNGCRLTEQKPS